MHFTYQDTRVQMFQCNVKIYNFNVPLSHMHKSIKEDPEIFLAFDFVLQHSGINKSILQQAGLKICSPKSLRQAGGVLELKQVLCCSVPIVAGKSVKFSVFQLGPLLVTRHLQPKINF